MMMGTVIAATVKITSQLINSTGDKPNSGDGKLLVGVSLAGLKVDSAAESDVENTVAAAWSVVTVVSMGPSVIDMAGSHVLLHC